MHQDKSIALFSKIWIKIGNKWPQFISKLRSVTDKDDESQVYKDDFIDVVNQFGGHLCRPELEELAKAFPGKDGGAKGVRLNVSRIYDQKFNQITQETYKKMNFEVTGLEDEPIDVSGYTGKSKFYRDLIPLKEISSTDFVRVIAEDNKMKEINFTISQIDNHTGAVTKSELDDILKLNYPEKLKDKNLMPIISRFSANNNKILIKHKDFK